MSMLQKNRLKSVLNWSVILKLGMVVFLGLASAKSWAQPANDNFASPQIINGNFGSTTNDTLGATGELGEPAHAGITLGGASVWYQWTAPLTGTVEFDTEASDYDTILAVYTGNTISNLVPVAANDDVSPTAFTSQVFFSVNAGTVYLIAVDDRDGVGGNLILNWTPGGALSGGKFGFATDAQTMKSSWPNNTPFPLYITSELDGFLASWSDVRPTTVTASATVTRLVGTAGKVLVNFTVTNSVYTNFYITNIFGTNIYTTNLTTAGITYSNSFTTNISTIDFLQNNTKGWYAYVPVAEDQIVTNVFDDNGIVTSTATNIPGATITNFFFTCQDHPTTVTVTTNSSTVTIVTIEPFCITSFVETNEPSAVDGQDYTSYSGQLEFKDYQMSAPILFTNIPSFSGSTYGNLNKMLLITLDSVAFDPLEDTNNLVAPIISTASGQALVNVLNMSSLPGGEFGPVGSTTNAIFGFERSHFQVSESRGTATFWVFRFGTNYSSAASVHYDIDRVGPPRGPNSHDFFPLEPGSDYATPTNSFPSSWQPADFTPISGTLNFPPFIGGIAVTVPIQKDNLVEFNEDLLLQLNFASGGVVGLVSNATLTILFEDQPAGAVDRNHNPDNSLGTIPPRNQAPGANGTVYAVAVQPDGKTVVAGDFSAYNTVPRNKIARMNLDGSLDTSFLADPNTGADEFITSMALDSNGKITIGGGFTSFNGTTRYSVARLNPNGSLDTSFNAGLGVEGLVWTLALQPDGKVVIGGNFTMVNGTNRNYIARLNVDGTVDDTFDAGGLLDKSVNSVAIQPDGKIVVGGEFLVAGGPVRGVVRLNPDGSLDTGFANQIGLGTDGTVFAVIIQTDGKIWVGGSFTTANNVDHRNIARLNADGSVDPTFFAGSGPNDTVYSMVVQPDGAVMVGGIFTAVNDTRRIGFARLYASGAVDTTFMDTAYNQFAGVVTVYANQDVEPKNFVYASALQPDGNVIIGGGFQHIGGGGKRDTFSPRQNVTRLLGGSTPGPGNIEFTYGSYTIDENGKRLYVSLTRTNGNLGDAGVSFGLFTSEGPGAAGYGTNFTFKPAQYANPTWPSTWTFGGIPSDTWMVSDGLSGPNFDTVNVLGQGKRMNPGADVFVDITDNSLIDGNHTVTMELFNPQPLDVFLLGGEKIPLGTALGRRSVPLLIVDNEAAHGVIGFSSPTYIVNEGGTNATITVTRTNGSSGLVTVRYATSNGTAIAGPANDYITTSGRLDFGPTETVKTFTIPIVDNSSNQPDHTVILKLTNVTGQGQAGLTNAVLTIIDNDFLPGRLNFSVTNFVAHEADGTAAVTVTRTGGNVGAVSIYCASSSGTAVNGRDYAAATNVLSWNAGDTSPKTFFVPLFHNQLVTSNLIVNLRLFSPVINNATNNNALGLRTNVTLTILDDDAYGSPSFSTTSFTVNENAGSAIVTVLRQGGSAESISVNYATSDIEAIAGTDYSTTSGTLNFGPGEFSKSFAVPINDDNIPNNNRRLGLTLSNPTPSGVTLGTSVAILTIVDDETFNEPSGGVDTSYNSAAGFNNTVYALTLQPDGKLLAGGDFTLANGIVRNHIARLNVDGTLDTKFSTVTGGGNGSVRCVVSQTDGRVLVGGLFTTFNGINRNYITRLNFDGSMDTGFNPGSGADNPIYAMAETFVDGTNMTRKVVVGGSFTTINGTNRFNIARLNDDGKVDSTFNPVTLNGTVYALAVYSTNDPINVGKILIAGDFTVAGTSSRSHIARLNVDGTLDNSFNPGFGANDSIRALCLQIDGKILIGGLFTSFNNTPLNRLARLNGNGSVDSNFVPGIGPNDVVTSIAIQEDQKIIVGGGFTQANGVTRNRLTRLKADGTVDPTINFGQGANDFVAALAIQLDGKILVGGGFTLFDDLNRPRLARLYGRTTSGVGTVEFTSAIYQVNENGTNAVIGIRRKGGTGDNTGNVFVQFATSNGTAISGVDYIGQTNTLTFPVGETFQTVTLPILNNLLVESNKTVNLTLVKVLPPGNAIELGGQPTAVLTILNDDSTVNFSAATYRVNKNAVNGAAVISVVRGGSAIGSASVDFSTTTNGTAIPVTDYIPTTNTIYFANGETSKIVTVPINNNGLVEGDLTVGMVLNNPSNTFLLNPVSATLTIVDNNLAPGSLMFSALGYSFTETATNAVITVVRTNGSVGQVSVHYTVNGGTATAGINYVATNGTLVFADGVTSKTFLVPLLHNPAVEGDQTVNLTLSSPTGGATITGSAMVPLTIVDMDIGLRFSTASYFVNETAGAVTISVLRVSGTNGAVSVHYATTNGTASAGLDYTAASGLLTFNNGETLKTFDIPILHNPQVEGNQTFSIKLFGASGTGQLVNPSAAVVTIIDIDSGFAFASATNSVNETRTNAIISVVRLGSTIGTASVNFATSDGTATAGLRYVGTNGVLTFLDGEASKVFTVPIINNNQVDGAQTVNLTLFNPTNNAQLLIPSNSVLTIVDDDAGFSFSSAAYSVDEGGINATITVLRSGVTNSTVSVDYATSDGTAHAGTKYFAVSGTLTFTNGEVSKTFSVPIIDESTIGGNETVILNLSNPSGSSALVNPNAAVLTIIDNDGSLIVAAGSKLVSESINPANGVIDSGETVSLLFGLRNVTGSNSTNLVATLLATNGVTPVGGTAQSYGALVTGGPSVSRQFSFTANGTNGGRVTAVFQLQDGSKNLGTASFTYTLGKFTNSFVNTNIITINDAAIATPYPSTINVSGVDGVITKLTMTVSNLNHASIADVSLLLVGPAGQKQLLMAHEGGFHTVNNVTLTFDDAAAASLSSSTPTSGTYKPTQTNAPAFPLPAPPSPYGTDLSALVGTNPNGSWSLYVLDDKGLDAGNIAKGWSLAITTTSPVAPAADLVVGLAATPIPVIVTSNLTYTITVTNAGPAAATAVLVSNTLPSGVTFVSATTSQGSVSANGGNIVYSLGILNKDGTASATLVVSPTVVGTITNTITIGALETDPNTGNNSATVVATVIAPSADLAIGLVDSPNPVTLGNNVTYSVTITNLGSATATNVIVTNILPAGLSFISASSSQGTFANASGTVTWNLGNLGSGALATVSVVAKTTAAGTITNTVSVGSGVNDPLKANNRASVKTVVDAVQLGFTHTGSTMKFSWPTSAGSYVLETTPNLIAPVTWTVVTNPPAQISGGQNTVTINASTGTGFFRLRASAP
ncbi:MAG: hypothetical protein JWQ71_4888 [Pedosphaera sp.]|nr:hypothetical protein [Pedosphaera sp.]